MLRYSALFHAAARAHNACVSLGDAFTPHQRRQHIVARELARHHAVARRLGRGQQLRQPLRRVVGEQFGMVFQIGRGGAPIGRLDPIEDRFQQRRYVLAQRSGSPSATRPTRGGQSHCTIEACGMGGAIGYGQLLLGIGMWNEMA